MRDIINLRNQNKHNLRKIIKIKFDNEIDGRRDHKTSKNEGKYGHRHNVFIHSCIESLNYSIHQNRSIFRRESKVDTFNS